MYFKKNINRLICIPIVAGIYGLAQIILILNAARNTYQMGHQVFSSFFIILIVVVISLLGIWIILLLLGSSQPLLKEYEAETILFNKKTKGITYFSEKICFWFWENNKLYPPKLMQESKFKDITVEKEERRVLITSNPRVLDITYSVVFTIRQELLNKTQESIQKKYNIFGNSIFGNSISRSGNAIISVNKSIKSALYEFSEKNLKELTKFYNPEDNTQQLEFSELVKEYLKEEMNNSPFTISEIKFHLN